MAIAAARSGGLSFYRWVLAMTAGWLLGFVLLVALAMAWSGITGSESQWMVGIGMGAGVGILQAHALRAWIPSPRRWFLASTVGMGIPFLLWDVGSFLGLRGVFSMPVCILLGSLLAGILEERLLRPRFPRSLWWVPTNVVSWGVPVLFIALGDALRSSPWTIVSTILLLLGGLLLGSISGRVLAWILASGPLHLDPGTDAKLQHRQEAH